MTTIYADRDTCGRAARAELGHEEFETVPCSTGWYWIDLSAAAAEAAGLENDPPGPSSDCAEDVELAPTGSVIDLAEIGLTEEVAAAILAKAVAAGTAATKQVKHRKGNYIDDSRGH